MTLSLLHLDLVSRPKKLKGFGRRRRRCGGGRKDRTVVVPLSAENEESSDAAAFFANQDERVHHIFQNRGGYDANKKSEEDNEGSSSCPLTSSGGFSLFHDDEEEIISLKSAPTVFLRRSRGEKSVSFPDSDDDQSAVSTTISIESLSSMTEEAKSELWYSRSQLELLGEMNQMTMQFLEDQASSSSQITKGQQEDPLFCPTGLEYAMSSSRKERARRHRSMLLDHYHAEDLAAVSRQLSKDAINEALLTAKELQDYIYQ